ncbi:MAG: replication-associated recombination protein A [Candidatus Marinimicrobia bacterium]|nr:replication-associated recombination protein A [Candidatus Neomarinimicrobiota bacterium]
MKVQKSTLPPLADRVRPTALNDFVGQEHIVGKGSLFRKSIETNELFSLIFWGPPGTGKTTLAKIIANETNADFYALTAVASGVKQVRKILAIGKTNSLLKKRTILFIDEIHHFSKTQQDALLQSVEEGTVILIGSTTENPSFEIISPLLSRCRVMKLEPLSNKDLSTILSRALKSDILLHKKKIKFNRGVRESLIRSAGGDARKMLNTLEASLFLSKKKEDTLIISEKALSDALQAKTRIYDKKGDYHYDTISAFIKSVRGSDPDAAIYWLATMLEGGEKPEFIARRLIILSSEDIGNADPQALVLATAGFQAVHTIGMPEAALILAQMTTYLASSPKSNASYKAISRARKKIQSEGTSSVPLHLRNAPTDLMKNLDYGKDYTYPHDEKDHFVEEHYFPEGMKPVTFYHPTEQGYEDFIKKRLKKLWKDRY